MEFKFCPKCGSESEKKLSNLLVCPACGFNFYLNPSPTNAVIIENQNGEILLATRKFDPKKGFLDLPGGFVESGESLEESSRREIREELGVKLNDLKYFGSYPDVYLFQGILIKTLGFVLTAKIDSGEKLTVSDDITEAKFYPKDSLPLEKIAFESLKQALRDYIK